MRDLLAAKGNLDARTLLEENRIFEEFKGAFTEQFIAQQLTAAKHKLYYSKNSSGELDFVLQQAHYIIPIEVKAEENLQAKSLRAYCDKYKPEIALRSSMSNYQEQDWMTNVPLYALDTFLKRFFIVFCVLLKLNKLLFIAINLQLNRYIPISLQRYIFFGKTKI